MASRRKKIIIGAIAVVVVGGVVASQARGGDRGIAVRIEEVESHDLVAIVTASGRIEPQLSVDIASDITGRIINLPVDEGDFVKRGQLLLTIDPTQFEAAMQRAEALLSAAKASELQAIVNRNQARRQLDRSLALRATDSNMVTEVELEIAQTNYDVAAAIAEAQSHQVAQSEASLREAQEQLAKTTLLAPMDGKITRLAVEEGEVALASTFSRETGLLMTVSDLSVIQVNVRVDETDVVRLTTGDSAEITIDAFPDTTFSGRVTKISQSAIRVTAGGSGDRAVDYEVEITLDNPPPGVLPDLSATAKVVTDTRLDAMSIPIIALTVREHQPISTEDMPRDTAKTEMEGVFVVLDGIAYFRPVKVGIAGEEHFEVIEGLALGDSIVAGPYQTIRDLSDSSAVRATADADDGNNGRE
ncbi:MAG: efflux RND transporter periplasmic adaptor subunit [Gemmatimonadetes bacterium]|nr:efflux RND transporter periplasmic adaptor subunit [Gemmatimonadota bacterium]